MNRRELEILVQAAREEGVFLMEAIWTRFLPSLHKVLDICENAELGELQHICADFGFRLDFNPEHRIFDPAKGGGCLLDIGIYPVFLALLLAGKPLDIKAVATLAPTGIDDSCSIILKQEGNVFSSLFCTFRADAPIEANILFEKGGIRIHSQWHTPAPITLYRQGRKPELIEFPEPGNGYQYEAAEVMRCLDLGLTESPGLPLDFSLDLMEILDRIREDCGIRYEQDFIK
jgi:predicted dehydrogenase